MAWYLAFRLLVQLRMFALIRVPNFHIWDRRMEETVAESPAVADYSLPLLQLLLQNRLCMQKGSLQRNPMRGVM